MITEQEIEEKYQELCKTESDIFLHLPVLRDFADRCNSVVECGVRGCVSLYAFLASKAARITAIDILDVWVPDVEKLTFFCADDLNIQIGPHDMLFIDTRHCYEQCIQELSLHAKNIRKYIAFHDTAKGTFGVNGDDGGKGLLFAIDEFLLGNPEWKLCYHNESNNGLSIIERV